MLLFIIAAIVLVMAAIMGISTWRDYSPGQGLGAAALTIVVAGIFGLMVWGITGSIQMEGAEHKTLSVTTYDVVPDSEFDVTSSAVKFVTKDSSGAIKPMEISFNDVIFDATNIKKVEVTRYDIINPGVSPWVWDTHNHITLK